VRGGGGRKARGCQGRGGNTGGPRRGKQEESKIRGETNIKAGDGSGE
jgi:hypothetical protein